MILCKTLLPNLSGTMTVPPNHVFTLPEKVLQFGTGVLLRGLPDYYIDKANREGIFNGRIAVVKSTPGDADDFEKQDNLYTVHIKGIEDGQKVDQQVINSAISRVLLADTQWEAVLKIARSNELQIVISNTTEVGIQFVAETITEASPASFPGKLLAVLLERYHAFKGDLQAGLVIVPTELVVNNGELLKKVVLQMAAYNNFDVNFIKWLINANHFCNSLVDRIVPGKPLAHENDGLNWRLGYTDNLRIVAEPYNLWAIQGSPEVARVLSFSRANSGVVIAPDIEKFRELKLRLLNGTHTLSCAIAFLSGFKTVDEAMDSDDFLNFVTNLMKNEITPAIPYPVNEPETARFAATVIDRFSNPYIKHQWLSISAQYSLKMRTRVVPLLLNYYKKSNKVPQLMCFGFAAFLAFMQLKKVGSEFKGENAGSPYTVTDSNAQLFNDAWDSAAGNGTAIHALMGNTELWGSDLTVLPGFEERVIALFDDIQAEGVTNTLKAIFSNER